MLDLHNEHRAKHNVLPLELHPKVSDNNNFSTNLSHTS